MSVARTGRGGGKGRRRAKKLDRLPVLLSVASVDRLRALASKWNVSTDAALERVLDQAFVGRGAITAARAAFVILNEALSTRTPALSDDEARAAFLKARPLLHAEGCLCRVCCETRHAARQAKEVPSR